MKRALRILAFSCAAFLCATGAVWLFLPRPPLWDGLGFSRAVYDENHELLRLTLSPDEKYRLKLPLAQISPLLTQAVLLKEDRHFHRHPGVNPVALVKAALKTYVLGAGKSGGSTITMQLARLRYGLKTRSVGGKLRQIFKALQLERHYAKDEILAAYLNLAPYGGNVEGAGAASLVYFGKNASALTLPEALTLAVIPQSPAARSPEKVPARADAALRAPRSTLFENWIKFHPQDAGSAALLDLPLKAAARKDLPFEAPHFSESVLKRHADKSVLVTTLNLGLQKILETHVKNHVETRRRDGITNAAALLLDWRDMSVKALVGSADFFDAAIDGQVDGTSAKRSPGSALKPFVYALAFDQGLLHPLSLLKDSPASFGGYDPENFDREFLGPVSVTDALVKSRNIPAVSAAAELNEPSFHGFLKAAGVTRLRDEKFYGLTTALGGAEVTMRELVGLYALLANGGILRKIRDTSEAARDEEIRLLSPEASFMALDILKGAPPPESEAVSAAASGAPAVAWKTGTSFSFRDAWTVGIAGPYVLAVWIGNFDGKGDAAFVGRKAAAPLFFGIVNHLKPRLGVATALPAAPAANLHLKRVTVCALSGGLPNPHCPHAAETWFIPGTSPIKPCAVHREVAVRTADGLRACSPAETGARGEVYEFWPSDLDALFKIAGVPRRRPPPYAPECRLDNKSAASGLAPEIVSPRRDVVYYVRADRAENERIAFKAVSDADAGSVYWFVDGDFVGKSATNKALLWTPKPGRFELRAVDDNGRADKADLRVSLIE